MPEIAMKFSVKKTPLTLDGTRSAAAAAPGSWKSMKPQIASKVTCAANQGIDSRGPSTGTATIGARMPHRTTPLAEMKLPINNCATNGKNRNRPSCAYWKKRKPPVMMYTASVSTEISWKAKGSVAESCRPSSQYSASQTIGATVIRPMAKTMIDFLMRSSSESPGSTPAHRSRATKVWVYVIGGDGL